MIVCTCEQTIWSQLPRVECIKHRRKRYYRYFTYVRTHNQMLHEVHYNSVKRECYTQQKTERYAMNTSTVVQIRQADKPATQMYKIERPINRREKKSTIYQA